REARHILRTSHPVISSIAAFKRPRNRKGGRAMANSRDHDQAFQEVVADLIRVSEYLLEIKTFLDGIVAADKESDQATQRRLIRGGITKDVDVVGTTHRQVGETMGRVYCSTTGKQAYLLTAVQSRLAVIHSLWERIGYKTFTQFLDDCRAVVSDSNKDP